jgi:hypothetical protein
MTQKNAIAKLKAIYGDKFMGAYGGVRGVCVVIRDPIPDRYVPWAKIATLTITAKSWARLLKLVANAPVYGEMGWVWASEDAREVFLNEQWARQVWSDLAQDALYAHGKMTTTRLPAPCAHAEISMYSDPR